MLTRSSSRSFFRSVVAVVLVVSIVALGVDAQVFPGGPAYRLPETQIGAKRADSQMAVAAAGRASLDFPPDTRDPIARECDQLAEHPADPLRIGQGVAIDAIPHNEAVPICEKAASHRPTRPRYAYLYGRALCAGQRYAEALRPLTFADQAGYALASVELAWMYERGLGVNPSLNEALRFYYRAGTAGLADDFLQGGMLLLNEKPPDYSEAASWFKRAAQGGSGWGSIYLGWLYQSGHGVAKDPVEAARLYEYSAKQGVFDGMYRLAMMYKRGEGLDQDYGAAAQWLYQAAKGGHVRAEEELGFLFASGQGVKQDYHAAFSWFVPAAQAGDVDAQYYLAALYDSGEAGDKNPAEAVSWYWKAAEQNDIESMYWLARHLREGSGVSWSEAQAMRWFRRAADAGFAPAQTALGQGYVQGLGQSAGQGVQDYNQGAYWLAKAAQQGDGWGEIDLGWLYDNGWGVEQDQQKARSLYQSASHSATSEAAETARKFLEATPSSAENTHTQPSDTSSDWVPGAIAIGVGVLALAAVFGGSSSHSDSSQQSSASSSAGVDPPSSAGAGFGGSDSSSSIPRTPVCHQVPVETASSTQNGACLTSPTSCGLSGATTLVCD
jgi:TPR repeat protein